MERPYLFWWRTGFSRQFRKFRKTRWRMKRKHVRKLKRQGENAYEWNKITCVWKKKSTKKKGRVELYPSPESVVQTRICMVRLWKTKLKLRQEMDWVHCNMCFVQPGASNKKFLLTSCGHVFCTDCLQGKPVIVKNTGYSWRQISFLLQFLGNYISSVIRKKAFMEPRKTLLTKLPVHNDNLHLPIKWFRNTSRFL